MRQEIEPENVCDKQEALIAAEKNAEMKFASLRRRIALSPTLSSVLVGGAGIGWMVGCRTLLPDWMNVYIGPLPLFFLALFTLMAIIGLPLILFRKIREKYQQAD